MTKQEEIEGWVFVMLRPICFSDKHCKAYVSDLFRGLSKRGLMIVTFPPQGADLTGCSIVKVEPLIGEIKEPELLK